MNFNKPAIDVSVYQGDIDWAQVKAAGIYAAVIRAGYGRYIDQEDKKFRRNYERARAAGVPVGVYCAFEDNPQHWGVISVDGRIVVDARYADVEIDSDGTARLTLVPGKTKTVRLGL